MSGRPCSISRQDGSRSYREGSRGSPSRANRSSGPSPCPISAAVPGSSCRSPATLRCSGATRPCPSPPTASGRQRGVVLGREVDRGVVLLLAGYVVLLLHRFRPVFPGSLPRYGLVGLSDPLLDLCRQIARVADLNVPVLLRGESGTGKELVAAALHHASSRRERSFLALNVGALPASLAAAELFGATRGAYTGAEQARRGYFRRAHGGTLFLDEIGETPQEVQPLLLPRWRAARSSRWGAKRRRASTCAFSPPPTRISSSGRAGRFRAPLLHALAATRSPPALRERRDDIGAAVLPLPARGARPRWGGAPPDRSRPEAQPWPPAAWIARLAAAPWPGNVASCATRPLSGHRQPRQRGRTPSKPSFPRLIEELLRAEESVVASKPPPARATAPAPTSVPPRRSPQSSGRPGRGAARGARRQPLAAAGNGRATRHLAPLALLPSRHLSEHAQGHGPEP